MSIVDMPPVRRQIMRATVAALMMTAGWATKVETHAATTASARERPQLQASDLVGTYMVTGTETDGMPYLAPRRLVITRGPSGALELEWENGVGVGEVIGRTLGVATWARGRTVILVMDVQADGSLSGRLLRRTDSGTHGGETWRRIAR